MGAPDDSIREELIGAVLGELSLLRRDVKDLSQRLETTGKRFKDDGELTLLRFTSRYERFLNEFAASSTDVLAEAGRFSEARDQLLGEISLRQYDEVNGRSRDLLRDVLREQRGCSRAIGRIELAAWTVCAMLGSAALTVGALAALRHLTI
ncbi:hypothetical protein [Paraburkholderia aspalathi]|uniref:hypothetical protein n=1 Tax=Paraburkholderia aspalathi TaxID=1324617 RepID=UPI0038B79288